MLRSIADDIRASFDYGNMVVKLIIINVGVYVITAILGAFFPSFYTTSILPYLALPGDPMVLLYRPWTLITHMFLHEGLWHVLWNMLTFYWFGYIVGDLIGDRKILPIYIIGGLFGALAFLISFQLFAGIGGMALGASAAIMAIVFAAVATAPDYSMNLILFGPVRIKYIGLVILFLDIIGTRSMVNSGGHIAHLGGALFGFLFVYLLRQGTDVADAFNRFIDFFKFNTTKKPKKRSTLKVAHKASDSQRATIQKKNSYNVPTRVDEILDKIKQTGYDSLTDEEKDVLYQASKN